MNHNVQIGQLYKVECYDQNGQLKWEDGFENIVVTTGRNQYLDATLKTGSASPTWFLGLKDSVAAVAADYSQNEIIQLNSLITNNLLFKSMITVLLLKNTVITSQLSTSSFIINVIKFDSEITNTINLKSKIK